MGLAGKRRLESISRPSRVSLPISLCLLFSYGMRVTGGSVKLTPSRHCCLSGADYICLLPVMTGAIVLVAVDDIHT